MKTTHLLLLTLLLSSCGGGSGSTGTSPGAEQPTPVTITDVDDYELQSTEALLTDLEAMLHGLSLDQFFEQSYAVLQARNPEQSLSEGDVPETGNASLTNISDAYLLQTAAVHQLLLEQLAQYPRTQMTRAQQLSADIYTYFLEQQLGWSDYYLFSYPATYGNFGWPGSTAFFFTDLLPVTTPEQAEQYLQLARQVGRRFRQISQLLESRQQAGITEPKITLQFSLDQVNAVVQQPAESTDYYRVFQDKINQIASLSSQQREDLLTRARATVEQIIQPGYQQLASQMQQALTVAPDSIGFSQYAGGDEFYAFTLRHYTDSERSADEIHQLGIQELERIHEQMNTLFTQLGYPQNESIRQKLDRAAADGGSIAAGAIVDKFEDIIALAYTELPNYFPTLPNQQVVVIGGETGGYYVSGSDDGVRPGAFYAQNTRSRPYYTMPTLAYHEAVPGHHLQIALAGELDLPTFRGNTNFTSFVEGWGLYAERLASELGWYNNDVYGDIGRLEFEAMRAARLVLDTGIHAKGWSYQQAEAFSLQNVGNRGSIARYAVYPGQATAYMTGLLDILSLRSEVMEQKGTDYSVAEFHQHILTQGSVPLSLLRPYILESLAQGE